MSIIDNVKEIADLIKKAGDIELYRKIVELEGEIIELTRSNQSLEEEVAEIKGLLAFSKRLTFRQPYYYAEDDDVPYCPQCWEADQKPIHLIGRHSSEGMNYSCTNCQTTYTARGYIHREK
jgi:hypothetical protein